MFGIPGEENIHLTDALSRSSIRYVLVRHEQAASFMAEIHGRLTGRAGVCSATLGPGAINLLLGTADAYTNSTPLLALSAQVGLNRIYKESHQSVDLVSMFAPVTKWSDLILTPGSIPEMVRKAFKLAQTERPGSVYLGVPGGRRGGLRARCAGATSRQYAAHRRALADADCAGGRRAQREPAAHYFGRARRRSFRSG